MDKNEVEKIIDEAIEGESGEFVLFPMGGDSYDLDSDILKKLILEKIIPEVLKSVLEKDTNKLSYDEIKYLNKYNNNITQKAKELYGIDL